MLAAVGCVADAPGKKPENVARVNASSIPVLQINGTQAQFSVDQDVEYQVTFSLDGTPDENGDLEVLVSLLCDYATFPTTTVDSAKLVTHGGLHLGVYNTLRATVLYGQKCAVTETDIHGTPSVSIVGQLARWRSDTAF